MAQVATNTVLNHRAFYGLLLLGFAQFAAAQNKLPFQIEAANTYHDDTVFFLNAYIIIELPDYIETAVEQGFALPLMLEVDILRQRTFWFDEKIVRINLPYVVHYLPLLDSVALLDVNSGSRRYYSNLQQALAHLGVFYNFPLLDNNPLESGQSYRGRLRFGIDKSQLPLPLKSSSLWDNDWSLASDWYHWVIRP